MKLSPRTGLPDSLFSTVGSVSADHKGWARALERGRTEPSGVETLAAALAAGIAVTVAILTIPTVALSSGPPA